MTSRGHALHPRKEPRQVRAELTRERILDAAAHVFADYGYAAGTTNRIAEQARISIGSLYQYYPNKDAILLELLNRHLDSGTAALRRLRAEEPSESLTEVLRHYVRATIENHRAHPHLLRVMAEQAPRSPELLEKTSLHEQELVTFARELFERHPQVRVADTEVAARLVVSMVGPVVHQLIAAPDPVDTDRFENELVAMLTRYLTGGPAGREEEAGEARGAREVREAREAGEAG